MVDMIRQSVVDGDPIPAITEGQPSGPCGWADRELVIIYPPDLCDEDYLRRATAVRFMAGLVQHGWKFVGTTFEIADGWRFKMPSPLDAKEGGR